MIWRLGEASRQPGQRLLARRLRADRLLGLAQCRRRPASRWSAIAESARNLVWIGLLYSLSARRRRAPAWRAAGLWRGRRGDRPAADRRQRCDLISPGGSDRPDQPDPADHHGRGRAGAGPQPLRPGRAGEPVAHPAGDARPRVDVELRPQPLHHRLSRRAPSARACSNGAALAVALTAPLFALGARQRTTAGASGCRARRPSSRSRCSRSAPISR